MDGLGLRALVPDDDVNAKPAAGFHMFSPKVMFIALFAVNLLNYCDRGIIPGSTNEFDVFISKSMDTDSPDVFLGILQSSFIVGFALASVVFGHLVHFYSPFFLCGVGLSIWVVAVVLSGVSFYADSFAFLVIARCLSGVGEASFQCSIPPWIEKNAEAGSKGIWLAVFFTAIPVGTAMGYTFSSFMSTGPGWQWAFFIEAIFMGPFIVFLFAASRQYPMLIGTPEESTTHTNSFDSTYVEHSNSMSNQPSSSASASPATIQTHENSPTMLEEFYAVCSSNIYLALVAGYAAQTGALIGVSTFGSAYLMGLGFFDSETQASTIFGIMISLAGIIFTPMGGILLDFLASSAALKRLEQQKLQSTKLSPEDEVLATKKATLRVALQSSTRLVFIASIIGAVLLVCVYFVSIEGLYLAIVLVGCGFIFLCTPAINLGIMHSVKVENRSFAIAICSVSIHAFGDVPSPILAGLLKDRLAPGCVGVDAASAQCREDAAGLRLTMLITVLWLGWTIIFFGIAYMLSFRSRLAISEGRLLDIGSDESLARDGHIRSPLLENETTVL